MNRKIKQILQHTEIYNLDYQDFIKKLIDNDKINPENSLIYLDPPYHNTYNGYFKKNENDFENDLLVFLRFLDTNKFKFIMSNSYNEFTIETFKEFNIDIIRSFDCMKNLADRSSGKEIVVFNNYLN